MASTQAQGKGKKKNKEVTKVPLEEFNQMNAPHGHSVISLKSLDWAETMADYDYQQPPEQILVPVAPRAQRGPGVDYDSLPNEPPFRVSLFNLPMSVEEKEVKERIFQDLDVLRVEITKSDTTVELGSKDALYHALCKDGATIKGRTVNVCLFGDSPQNFSDRYGGRGGNDRYGDRYGDRGSGGGFGGSRMGDRYGDRSGGGSGGGFGRDRDGYSGGGYNRVGSGGFGQPRGGYGDRFDRDGPRDINRGSYTSAGREPAPDREEPDNWRAAARPTVKPTATPTPAYNNGTRQPYVHPRPEPSHYQQPPARHQQYHQESSYQPRYQHNQSSESHFMPPSQYNDRPGPNSRIMNSEPAEERPKLVLQKRTAPINVDDVSSVPRNAAIFGKALPNSKTYEKMKEIEEKLSTVQVSERQTSSHGGSQPGSAPRSRQISERSRD